MTVFSSLDGRVASLTSVSMATSIWVAKRLPYLALQYTPKTTPSRDQPATMPHSCGARAAPEPGTMYMTTMKADMRTAMAPTNL